MVFRRSLSTHTMAPLYSISRLPLPSESRQLTNNLTADPLAPTPSALFSLLRTDPASLRRSRPSDPSAHFSYVTPLPLPFPYRIPPPQTPIESAEAQTSYVQTFLTSQEPLQEEAGSSSLSGLKKYHSVERTSHERELLSLASTCLQDCLPHLDVGDALEVIGPASLSNQVSHTQDAPNLDQTSGEKHHEDRELSRNELIAVLSGDLALMALPSPDDPLNVYGYVPWSLRYSGHQFGQWAGQLGDGRAISILETPLPNDPSTTYELQIKGCGRTPFSRSADGLAVLRSSVREFLAAEAMHALRIPTTRSLALISVPTLPVARETRETAAMVTRVAESFIRIGSFQALNPPDPDVRFVYLGGGGGAAAQQDPDYEALRKLGEWVSKKVLKLDIPEGEAWAQKLVWECARRNAVMVAGWQQMGFMHGVMNTDNISIMGLTLDYGPYAFMDVFSNDHVCNHSDEQGRYSYKLQPTMIIYALRALLKSLAPVIGAEGEAGGKSIQPGWAANATKEDIENWTEDGMKLSTELETYFMEAFSQKYWELMRNRLSLKHSDPNDSSKVIRPLLELMEKHGMDFHRTFRLLTAFRPALLQPSTNTNSEGNDLKGFLTALLPADRGVTGITVEVAAKDCIEWLETFTERLTLPEEQEAWVKEANQGEHWLETRERVGKLHNPRFVLRQWLLEEVIEALQKDAQRGNEGDRKSSADFSRGKQVLNKILAMAIRPFEPWGAESDDRPESELSPEEQEERRLCGVGEKRMLGFQCSCSS